MKYIIVLLIVSLLFSGCISPRPGPIVTFNDTGDKYKNLDLCFSIPEKECEYQKKLNRNNFRSCTFVLSDKGIICKGGVCTC